MLKDPPRVGRVCTLPTELSDGLGEFEEFGVANELVLLLAASCFSPGCPAANRSGFGVIASLATFEASLIDFVGDGLPLCPPFLGLGVAGFRREVEASGSGVADLLGMSFFVALDLIAATFSTPDCAGVFCFAITLS